MNKKIEKKNMMKKTEIFMLAHTVHLYMLVLVPYRHIRKTIYRKDNSIKILLKM